MLSKKELKYAHVYLFFVAFYFGLKKGENKIKDQKPSKLSR